RAERRGPTRRALEEGEDLVEGSDHRMVAGSYLLTEAPITGDSHRVDPEGAGAVQVVTPVIDEPTPLGVDLEPGQRQREDLRCRFRGANLTGQHRQVHQLHQTEGLDDRSSGGATVADDGCLRLLGAK